MKKTQKIEYITHSDPVIPSIPDNDGQSFSRVKVFLLTFSISLLIGLVINFSRPAVYQAEATLLTSAPTAVDQQSMEADVQHVAIQRQKLLGFDLLSETLLRLKKISTMADISLADIRQMLDVKPILGTNLLSMTATGDHPDFLPTVINTWIDVYLEARQHNTEDASQQTRDKLRNELDQLENQIKAKQQAIALFRKQYHINSSERVENEHLAGLNALNKAYNDAKEEEVKTKAKLDAIKQAIAEGRTVVPQQEQRSLSDLERRYQQLKEKLAEFDKRYTRDYLYLQPSLKFIPEQIKKLEKEIRIKRKVGQNSELTKAYQEYQAAKQVTKNLQKKLAEQQKKAAEFTTLFAKYEQLTEDLKALEELYRDTQVRLAKVESSQFEKYPQVDVIERASFNDVPIGPDYTLGSLIAFGVALFLALFSLWLIDFLTVKDKKQADKGFHFPVSVWFNPPPDSEKIEPVSDTGRVEQKHDTASLPFKVPEYSALEDDTLESLFQLSNPDTQQLILLLLSGLTPAEISRLKFEQVDLETGLLHLPSRTIPLGKRLQQLLENTIKTKTLWQNKTHLSEDDIDALLYCAFVDAGIESSQHAPAAVLRQTYIIYLVQQGLRLNLLETLVGPLTPVEMAGFSLFSPEQRGKRVDQINPIYPLCDEAIRSSED